MIVCVSFADREIDPDLVAGLARDCRRHGPGQIHGRLVRIGLIWRLERGRRSGDQIGRAWLGRPREVGHESVERGPDNRRDLAEPTVGDDQDAYPQGDDGQGHERPEGQRDPRSALNPPVGDKATRCGRSGSDRRRRGSSRRRRPRSHLGWSPASPCRHRRRLSHAPPARARPMAAALRSVVVLRGPACGSPVPMCAETRDGCRLETRSAIARLVRWAGPRSASDRSRGSAGRPPTRDPRRLRCWIVATTPRERRRVRRRSGRACLGGSGCRSDRPSPRCHRRAAASGCRTSAATCVRTST